MTVKKFTENNDGERRLAAVVFADIAGYTALMQRNEQEALDVIQHFRSATERLVTKHAGQLVQFYGDGSLLIFDSAVSSLQYAFELQQTLQDPPSVPLRVGVHQGDIILAGGNVFGNTVNIAARVESMGVPGAILFSDKVRSDLSNQTGFDAKSLGHFEFKNVTDPIEVFALVRDQLIVPKSEGLTGKFKAAHSIKTIAVLPFVNRSSDPEQDYFAEGVAEEIMIGLAGMDLLKVAGRASSFFFKDTVEDVPTVAAKLHVDHLLCGSVRKMGQRVRVSAELLNGADGFQIWTERYDKEIDDIFQIQDEIAAQVIEALKLILLNRGQTTSPIITAKTSSPIAFDLYLQGKSYLDRRGNITKALKSFRSAIEIDTSFGYAYNSLAYAHMYQVLIGNAKPLEGFSRAQKCVSEAALILGPNAESMTIKAWLDFYLHHDYDACFEGFRRSIILDSTHADTLRIKAYLHLMMGHKDIALADAIQSLELDPLSANIKFSLWDIRCKVEDDEHVQAGLEELKELHFDDEYLYDVLGQYYMEKGMIGQALDAFSKVSEKPAHFNLYSFARFVFHAKHGDKTIAELQLNSLMQESEVYVKPSYLAILLFYLGNEEESKRYVRRAIDESDPILIQMHRQGFLTEFFNYGPVVEALAELNLPWQSARNA